MAALARSNVAARSDRTEVLVQRDRVTPTRKGRGPDGAKCGRPAADVTPISVTHVSLAGVPMELHLGSPAGEPLALRLNALADLVDAGLFGDIRTFAKDSIGAFLERCAQHFAEQYEDVPLNVEMSRLKDAPTPFVVTLTFDYVEVIECHDFLKSLARADRKLAVALVEELSASGSWWFPVFGPRAAYETADNERFAFPDEWWDQMREETKDANGLKREPTNREVRRYIRTMNVVTRGTYIRRIGAMFCRARGRTRVPFKACADRIAKLRSKPLQKRALAFHSAISELHKLRRMMERSYSRDDREIRADESYYDSLPAVIFDNTSQFQQQGYVTELFTEYEQGVMSGNGWGPNYYFALEATQQSVTRLKRIVDAYGKAYQVLFTLKDAIGDGDE